MNASSRNEHHFEHLQCLNLTHHVVPVSKLQSVILSEDSSVSMDFVVNAYALVIVDVTKLNKDRSKNNIDTNILNFLTTKSHTNTYYEITDNTKV